MTAHLIHYPLLLDLLIIAIYRVMLLCIELLLVFNYLLIFLQFQLHLGSVILIAGLPGGTSSLARGDVGVTRGVA